MRIFNWAWSNVSDKQIPFERFSKALSTLHRKNCLTCFLVAFVKSCNPMSDICNFSSLLRLKFMIILFLSLVEDTLGTSEENGMMVDQALEHIQCSTHSACEPGCLQTGLYQMPHLCTKHRTPRS